MNEIHDDRARRSSLTELLSEISSAPNENVAAAAAELIAAIDAAGSPSNGPFLSVLVRTQGFRMRELGDVLLCLSAQTETDFEVILIRHDAAPAAAAAIDTLVGEQDAKFQSRIRILDAHGGTRAVPLNCGLQAATGQYIAVLDDDDAVYSNWVQAFRDAAARHPGVVLRARVGTESVTPEDWPRIAFEFEAGSQVKDEYPHEFDLFAHTVVSYSPFMGLAFPRLLFHSLGVSFDESLDVLEDWDVVMRTALLVGVADVPSLTAIYRNWTDRDSSVTLHNSSIWSADERRILAELDRLPRIVPPGSIGRIRELVVAEKELAAVRMTIKDLRDSTSWRVTGPLRAIGKRLAALRR